MPKYPNFEGGRPEKEHARDWREVPRAHDVIAIGDLHGKYNAFIGNSTYANIGNEDPWGNLSWKGRDTQVVYVGDILGDRGMDGLEILGKINTLEPQAKKEGGNITLLAGNHDNWAIGMLIGAKRIDGLSDMAHMINKILPRGNAGINQGVGLIAYITLLKELGVREDVPDKETFAKYTQAQQYAFAKQALANTSLWQDLRRAIADSPYLQTMLSRYQIAHIIDDTLFLHCDPTNTIVNDLLARAKHNGSLREGVQELNVIYQENLKRCLNDAKEKPNEAYEQITETYLATLNRGACANPNTIRKLREEGINAIVHGHTEPVYGLHNMPAEQFPEEFLIMTADQGAYKQGRDDERSVARINKQGEIMVGEKNITLRKR